MPIGSYLSAIELVSQLLVFGIMRDTGNISLILLELDLMGVLKRGESTTAEAAALSILPIGAVVTAVAQGRFSSVDPIPA